jgi:hypothetical protein
LLLLPPNPNRPTHSEIMAPLPESSLRSYISSLLSRSPAPSPSITLPPRAAALIARTQQLVARTANPAVGVTEPSSIPNKAVFVLFGLIGASFVVAGIWFFFWAKNGGFYFKEDDWEEYKSTVLRRKGPNGTTLSGATESTDLGGGSVVHGEKSGRWGRKKGRKEKRYKDFDFDEQTEYTGSNGGESLDSEMTELKSKNVIKKSKNRDKKSKRGPPTEASEVGTLVDEEMDVGVHEELRAYRHEKPAKVGGLNREADGSAFDGSTHDGSSAASELLSHREKTPTHTPTRVRRERERNHGGSATGSSGIRKVVSTSESGSSAFWSRSSASGTGSGVAKSKTLLDTTKEAHIKAEAARLQEKGRAAQRRDFSFQTGDDGSTVSGSTASDDRAARREERERRRRPSRSPVKRHLALPATYEALDNGSELGSDLSGDIGTKSYHHPIPGLSSSVGGSEYADEKRRKRNGESRSGYRRGRGDELD